MIEIRTIVSGQLNYVYLINLSQIVDKIYTTGNCLTIEKIYLFRFVIG